MMPLRTVFLATEGEEAGIQLLPDTAELIWGTIAFALLMAVLSRFVFPRINTLLEERQSRIQGQLEEAEAVRNEAEELRRQYQQRLTEARDEANEIIEQARSQAESVRADTIAKGEQEADEIRARAREDADAERGRLARELRAQVAVLSVDLASKIVGRELDGQRHRELVDSYINDLSSLN